MKLVYKILIGVALVFLVFAFISYRYVPDDWPKNNPETELIEFQVGLESAVKKISTDYESFTLEEYSLSGFDKVCFFENNKVSIMKAEEEIKSFVVDKMFIEGNFCSPVKHGSIKLAMTGKRNSTWVTRVIDEEDTDIATIPIASEKMSFPRELNLAKNERKVITISVQNIANEELYYTVEVYTDNEPIGNHIELGLEGVKIELGDSECQKLGIMEAATQGIVITAPSSTGTTLLRGKINYYEDSSCSGESKEYASKFGFIIVS